MQKRNKNNYLSTFTKVIFKSLKHSVDDERMVNIDSLQITVKNSNLCGSSFSREGVLTTEQSLSVECDKEQDPKVKINLDSPFHTPTQTYTWPYLR